VIEHSEASDARVWGAHAPRVLAMTPSSSRTYFFIQLHAKVRCGEAPQPAREARAFPKLLVRVIDLLIIAHALL